MVEVMNSVSVQIRRAINDAKRNQVLPQIQNALKASPRQMTQRGCTVSVERPEYNSENNPSQKTRSNSTNEPFRSRLCEKDADNAHDTVPCDVEVDETRTRTSLSPSSTTRTLSSTSFDCSNSSSASEIWFSSSYPL